jgi:hypothetical protein
LNRSRELAELLLRKAAGDEYVFEKLSEDPKAPEMLTITFFAARDDFGAPRGASVHACEPAVLPAYVPLAFCPATSRLENRLQTWRFAPRQHSARGKS